MQHFMNGVNLGGWLSQYQKIDQEHFRTFITLRDIQQIAAWGFDHVRLPVDYPLLEADHAVGKYLEEGFRCIDACLEWCQASGLGVVVDLHKAPGYSFTNTLQPETQHLNVLFHQDAAQQRLIALWEFMVRRYHSAGLPIIFELLNEVVLPESSPWNALAHKLVNALHTIAPGCKIMIGGNHYNAASELKNIALLDDPDICYTFHFYEPLLFTHQKAPWVQAAVEYNQEIDYPGSFTDLEAFLQRAPQWQATYGWLVNHRVDRALLLDFLQPAVDFVQNTGLDLYCGEFGVIETVNPANRQRWHADFLAILRAHNIGSAVWSYKQMDFGLVDSAGRVVDPDLLAILCSA